MSQLDFITAFVAHLNHAPVAHPFFPASHPALAVYQNTVSLGALDALRANYPSVLTLVGDEWFNTAANCTSLRSHHKQPNS
jgi:Putative DNA-binding domain